ncbi:acyl-coenzyme A:Isopenicillin N acyltransferase [Blastomyces dermatitidis ATCC 18188]|uniref:Acyl-coenzyme A:Isopenicillin N acyltransferase n=1 Tax=Ajellomyces dermatitidis (strain ATCC 18188 / CBS 674.68) TaxID=653446 RepID=F2T5I7_AJEDA|nr:acyl-coenzyme A:Isopenicillin N acyltransferase [Blastomyces dermatitidis ATCC 18188]
MLSISCEGNSYEIGLQHGEHAREQVAGSLEFYEGLFKRRCLMDWQQVCDAAVKFVPFLETSFPGYIQEMRGIAQGAGVPVESILALNVRTEIAYGMFNDGCTAFSWKSKDDSFLAQNWDVMGARTIPQPTHPPHPPNRNNYSRPDNSHDNRSGIIGKIGLNSHGVGVTLNAIKAAGVDFGKLPTHLALRAVLDSVSRADAVEKLERYGVAAACNIIVADRTGGVGLECSARDVVRLEMGEREEDGGGDVAGVVTHSNHFIRPHLDTEGKVHLVDTLDRLKRVRELVKEKSAAGPPSVAVIEEILKDEQSYPTGICREVTEDSSIATLFCIVMDLGKRTGLIKMGRPVKPEGEVELRP